MEQQNCDTYYILKILKADNTTYRTATKIVENVNGRIKYLDLLNLKIISALAKGNRALLISRCLTTPVDRIITCDPLHYTLINSDNAGPFNIEDADEETRKCTINKMLVELDKQQSEKRKRKTSFVPIRVGKK